MAPYELDQIERSNRLIGRLEFFERPPTNVGDVDVFVFHPVVIDRIETCRTCDKELGVGRLHGTVGEFTLTVKGPHRFADVIDGEASLLK